MPKTIKNKVETEFRANDRMTRQLSRMNRAMNRLKRMSARLKRGLKAAGRAALFLGRQAGRVAKVGLLAMAGAATAVFYSVTKLAQGMDDLAKKARSINFPIEEFQEWRFAAEQSGVQQATFDKSIQKFTRTIGELKGGYGAMYTALSKTNKPLLKQLKNTTDVSSALDIYLGSIREAGGATEKAALSAAGFGRAGIDMINLANLSAKELNGLRKQMRENGVVTEAQARKAEEYNDMMNRVRLTLKSVAVDGLTPLMPLMTDGMDSFRKWVTVNRGLIKQKIETIFKKMLKFGKQAFNFLKRNIPPLIKQLKQIGKNGFAWLRDNKEDIKEFGRMILWLGGRIKDLTGFAWRNKEMILALAIAYKGLGFALASMNFVAASGGFAKMGMAIGAAGKEATLFAKIMGTGGVVVASLTAGVAIGSIIFDQWDTAMDNLLTRAQNVSSRIGMMVHKMESKELETALKQEKQKQKSQDSLWTGVRALFTGRLDEREQARKASRQAQIDILKEQKRRLVSVSPQMALPEKIKGARAGVGAAALNAPSGLPTMSATPHLGNDMVFTEREVEAQTAQPQVQTARTEHVEKKEIVLTVKDPQNRLEPLPAYPQGDGLTLNHTGGMIGAT